MAKAKVKESSVFTDSLGNVYRLALMDNNRLALGVKGFGDSFILHSLHLIVEFNVSNADFEKSILSSIESGKTLTDALNSNSDCIYRGLWKNYKA